MKLAEIADTLLDETSTPAQHKAVLAEFSKLCSDAGGVEPHRSFDAWAEDSFLAGGVAINSQAAAHCVTDYRRTVVFIRGVHSALMELTEHFPGTPIQVLYAGCGPYATLLLPLLERFDPARLELTLLDYHQQSLDSAARLLEFFGLQRYRVCLKQADACDYQHPQPLHLIVAEVMQKALEQEPQFAVTAQLASQLAAGGIFIPQQIEIELCLGSLAQERAIFERDGRLDATALTRSGRRVSLGKIFTLLPEQAPALADAATHNALTGKTELLSTSIEIPAIANLEGFDALLLTRIQVFADHQLGDYEADITLPLRCAELGSICSGERYRVSYELGSYPKFALAKG